MIMIVNLSPNLQTQDDRCGEGIQQPWEMKIAYMTKDGKGPYPNKKGEYCGNHLPSAILLRNFHETKEMAAKGWVGVYLTEDVPVYDGNTEIDTPPELMEPDE